MTMMITTIMIITIITIMIIAIITIMIIQLVIFGSIELRHDISSASKHTVGPVFDRLLVIPANGGSLIAIKLPLPDRVDVGGVKAKFSKKKQTLTVKAPVDDTQGLLHY